MPPKRDSPSTEESIAAMSENISKLTASTNLNNDKILANQAASSLQLENLGKQLENLGKQLATQNEQNVNLIATLTQTLQRTTQMLPPKALPPNRDLQIRPPKLNPPAFDGTNPLDCLFQADQYFSLYNITPPQCLATVAFYLSGDALSWHKYLYNNNLLTTWEAFTRAIETRFGPSFKPLFSSLNKPPQLRRKLDRWNQPKKHCAKPVQRAQFFASTTVDSGGRCYAIKAQQAAPMELNVVPVQARADDSSSSQVAEAKPNVGPSRCFTCPTRVGLTGFNCKCGDLFCSAHRYSVKHGSPFDHQTVGRDAIAKANPVIKAKMLDKI
uniref:Zinc finger A20 and AN1 domain-containing stress-associated protein 8-like n=1 Tax=Tanacetum cinerariifolium TaxID=118510 RepID=A0A6L2L883_TANCI|nr:zinc finger A20 and AN1 domain-containing stress-associated protein 8-like [Tanacetum cinerariifolium]